MINFKSTWPREIPKIQQALALCDEELCESFQVSNVRLQILKKDQFKDLAISELINFTNYFHLGLDAFIKGEYDLKFLKKKRDPQRIWEQAALIPERYEQAKVSACTSILNLLEMTERRLGIETKNEALKFLQVHPQFFFDAQKKVSVLMVEDLYDFLEKRFFSREDFFQLGKASADFLINSPHLNLREEFANFSCPYAASEFWLEEKIRLIDGTWDYKILQSSNGQFRFQVTTSEKISEIFKTKNFGGLGSFETKAGFASQFLQYTNYTGKISLTRAKNSYEGDSVCEYVLHFEDQYALSFHS